MEDLWELKGNSKTEKIHGLVKANWANSDKVLAFLLLGF